MEPKFFDNKPVVDDPVPIIPDDLHISIRGGSNFLPSWFQDFDIWSNGYLKMVRGERRDTTTHRWFRLFWNEQALASVMALMEHHGIEHARSVQRQRVDGDHLHLKITWNKRSIDVWVDGEFEDHVCPFVVSLNELLPDTMQIYYSYLNAPPTELK